MMFEQKVVDDRHAEKDRRPMLGEDSADDVGRRLLATENRCGAVQERKRKTVAQAVSERQSRR